MCLSCVMSRELLLKFTAASRWRHKQPWPRMRKCPLPVSNPCTRPRQSSIDCTERTPTAPQKDLCPPVLRSLSRRHIRCSEKCTRSGTFWSLPLLLHYVATQTVGLQYAGRAWHTGTASSVTLPHYGKWRHRYCVLGDLCLHISFQPVQGCTPADQCLA